MKKNIVLIGFLLAIVSISFAQNPVPDYGKLVTDFQKAERNRNFKGMKISSDNLIKYYPDDFAGYALKGFFYSCRGQNNQAEGQYNVMIKLNPMHPSSYILMAMHYYIVGKKDLAEQYSRWAFQLADYPEFKLDVIKDIDAVKEMAYRQDLEGFKSMVNAIYQDMNPDYSLALSYTNCFNTLRSGNDCDGFDQAIAKLNLKKPFNPAIEVMGLFIKSVKNYVIYENEKAKKGFDQFLAKTENSRELFSFYRASAYYYKATMYYANYNNRSALTNIKKAISEIKRLPITTLSEANFYFNKLTYENELKLNDESLQSSFNLLAIAEKLDSNLYRAQASNNIGQNYLESVNPSTRAQAANYIYNALQFAKKGGYSKLENSIRGNYVIVLWQQGKHAEAKQNSDVLYDAFMKANKYNQAEITANNLAFMYYYDKDYNMAADYFKKAMLMTEQIRKQLKPKQRLQLMNERNSAYSGLVMAYQKLRDARALFEVQDNNRSRFLRDRLKPDSKPATLQQAQALLGPDDLLLYYTLSGPGEVIINAITQNNAKIFYNYPIDDWIYMKKQWTDKSKKIPPSFNKFMQGYTNDIVDGNFITYADKEQNFTAKDFRIQVSWTRQLLESSDSKFDQARNAFLRHWYNFTLKPLEQLLSSKTNIIISSSNELNYLPFEAFIDNNGNYFITNHNVKYIPSVSVWNILKNRHYDNSKKPALVMGGAVYQPSGNVKGTARNIDDYYAISESLNEKISAGDFDFKKELKALGFGGANYLKGTLDEATFVGKLNPNVKVVTGLDMKESYLKRLSRSGELKNYKTLMLSTHGFTLDIIPELSGVMMSQPNNGDGIEDTFLLAPEIARLNLEADLAILSACDTGIGALFGGEGINGLNSAFLVAGANRTLLSLWPVNDYSTSLTMKNLFKMILLDGKDSFTAINAIKRAMANGEAGEEFRKPKYWAPFLLNGK